MKLQWFGHSCFGLTFSDGTRVITDPFDASIGYPVCEAVADVVTVSHGHFDHSYTASLRGEFIVCDQPGECRVHNLKIQAVESCHDDVGGAKRGRNLIQIVEGDGLRVAHLGDLGHELTNEQIAALHDIDVALIPIGGFYTIDTPTAIRVLAQFKPRCAVAMHFANAWCHFPISDERAFVEGMNAQYAENPLEIVEGDVPSGAIVMRYAPED